MFLEARDQALADFSSGGAVDGASLTNRLWLIPTAEVPLTNLVRCGLSRRTRCPCG